MSYFKTLCKIWMSLGDLSRVKWAATWENRFFFFICENKDADQLRGNRETLFKFATRIVQSLYLLTLKFQASTSLLWLYSLVCVGTGNPEDRFSHVEAQMSVGQDVFFGSNGKLATCADPENFLRVGEDHLQTRGGPKKFTIAKTHILENRGGGGELNPLSPPPPSGSAHERD